MSEQEQARVFEPFQQTDSVESQKMNRHGNGVGLSICKQICESLEGQISVVSKQKVGSKFTFTHRVFQPNNEPFDQVEREREAEIAADPQDETSPGFDSSRYRQHQNSIRRLIAERDQ